MKPNQATFVPDGEDQFTSDHGWDLATDGERLKPLIDECHALGVRVSLFMDASPDVMPLVGVMMSQSPPLKVVAWAEKATAAPVLETVSICAGGAAPVGA